MYLKNIKLPFEWWAFICVSYTLRATNPKPFLFNSIRKTLDRIIICLRLFWKFKISHWFTLLYSFYRRSRHALAPRIDLYTGSGIYKDLLQVHFIIFQTFSSSSSVWKNGECQVKTEKPWSFNYFPEHSDTKILCKSKKTIPCYYLEIRSISKP